MNKTYEVSLEIGGLSEDFIFDISTDREWKYEEDLKTLLKIKAIINLLQTSKVRYYTEISRYGFVPNMNIPDTDSGLARALHNCIKNMDTKDTEWRT